MPSDARTPAAAPLFPRLGAGVGLRPKHYGAALAPDAPLPDFFEVVTENFFGAGGRPREVLEAAVRLRPLAFHGVSLSIGSLDPLDERYLERLAALCDRFRPALVSDHLCFTSHGGRHTHDLLPLAFTPREADRIAARVRDVQSRLGRRILLENVSSYLAWKRSTMSEWAFLAHVAEAADCGILLDVNNVHVSAANHGFDAHEYLDALPPGRVGQIHLAGHADRGRYLFDTHDAPVPEPVWSLYERALARFGPVSTLLERDAALPAWEALLAESGRARHALEARASSGAGPLPAPPAAGPARASAGEEGASATAPVQALLWSSLAREEDGALPEIASGGRLSPRERLDVYAEAYRARLHDALAEDFRATGAFLGPDRFRALALEYARARPSTSPDLRDFGAGLPALLAARGLDAAAELAALEWARVESFDAADAAPLAADALAGVTPDRWPSLRLRLHPSVRRVRARFRVDEVWRRVDRDEAPGIAQPASGALRTWREGTTVFHAWMDVAETAALDALADGAPFREAVARAADALPAATPAEAAARLAGWLRDWVADGLFAGIVG